MDSCTVIKVKKKSLLTLLFQGDEQNNLINDRTPLGQGTPLVNNATSILFLTLMYRLSRHLGGFLMNGKSRLLNQVILFYLKEPKSPMPSLPSLHTRNCNSSRISLWTSFLHPRGESFQALSWGICSVVWTPRWQSSDCAPRWLGRFVTSSLFRLLCGILITS